jgi:hypothetical protein
MAALETPCCSGGLRGRGLPDGAAAWAAIAANRTRVSSNPEVRASSLLEESAHAIKLIANDLVKIFYGNKRW